MRRKAVQAVSFKPGDFMRLKSGTAGSVGVVWQVHPDKAAPVEVYWRETENTRTSQDYEPESLTLVPLGEVPDYAAKLKESLGL